MNQFPAVLEKFKYENKKQLKENILKIWLSSIVNIFLFDLCWKHLQLKSFRWNIPCLWQWWQQKYRYAFIFMNVLFRETWLYICLLALKSWGERQKDSYCARRIKICKNKKFQENSFQENSMRVQPVLNINQ